MAVEPSSRLGDRCRRPQPVHLAHSQRTSEVRGRGHGHSHRHPRRSLMNELSVGSSTTSAASGEVRQSHAGGRVSGEVDLGCCNLVCAEKTNAILREQAGEDRELNG